jgi:Uma2 family endonuclease
MTIHARNLAASPPLRLFSTVDVRRMTEAGILSEDERIELIDGEIVRMNAKNNAHEIIKNELVRAMAARLPRGSRLCIESTLYLDELTFLEPDILVYSKIFLPEDVRGPDVDLIIEVADSSKAYDLGRKASIYARFGVRELWVIEAEHRVTTIHRNPIDGEWTSTERLGPEASLAHSALPGWSVRLVDLD